MATFTEKTAAFLRQFVVKQASLLTLDSFLTKVAAALPMAKRAAFRAIQTELSSGNNLSHAIKVAFPRLSGEQRGALAVNLCKCAADSEYKKRIFESYAVPVKEGNKMLREKCSMLDLEKMRIGGPSMEPRSAPMDESTREFKDNLRIADIRGRVADATSSPKTDPGYVPEPSKYVNDANPIRPAPEHNTLLSALSAMPSPLQPLMQLAHLGSAPGAVPAAGAIMSGINKQAPGLGQQIQNAASSAGSAASAAGPLISKGLSGSSDAGASGPFAGINPYLLGALGIGGLGLGAYGVSRMMGRKKRRDED